MTAKPRTKDHKPLQAKSRQRAFRILPLLLMFLLSAFAVCGQSDLPPKFRGYRVHRTPVKIAGSMDNTGGTPAIHFDTPEIFEFSVTGITLSVNAKLLSPDRSGKVESLVFRDFKINGLAVEIADHKTSFEFKRGELVQLPQPSYIFLPTPNVLRGAWREATGSKQKWNVTGRIFVLGTFTKFGMKFKRAVPVEIDVLIDNPLKEYFASH